MKGVSGRGRERERERERERKEEGGIEREGRGGIVRILYHIQKEHLYTSNIRTICTSAIPIILKMYIYATRQ